MTKRKLIKDSFAFFRYLFHQKYSDEIREDKRKISLYFCKALIVIVAAVVIPFIFASAFATAGIILQIVFLAAFLSILYDVLKKWPVAETLDEYTDFLKKYYKIRSGKDEKSYSKTNFTDAVPNNRKSILNNKAVSIVFGLLIITTFSILLYYRIYNIVCKIKYTESEGLLFMDFSAIEIVACIVLIAVIFFVVMIDRIYFDDGESKTIKEAVSSKINSMDFSKIKDNIIIDPELSQWKDDIVRMCEYLHINSIYIHVNDNAHDIAEVIEQKVIPISRYYLSDIYQYFDGDMPKKIIMFIIGHELAHIYFNDNSKRRILAVQTAVFAGTIIYFYGTGKLLGIYNLTEPVLLLLWSASII